MTRSVPAPTTLKLGVRVMAKTSDIVAILEWAERKTAFKQPKGNGRKSSKVKRFDLVERLRQNKEESELLEKFLEEQSKLKKKEDKKEDKKRQFHGLEWYIIGICSYPVFMYLSDHLPAVMK